MTLLKTIHATFLITLSVLFSMSLQAKNIETTIEINGTPEAVWRVLTNMEAHASWDPFITSMQGDLKVGKKINVTIAPPNQDGMNFTPTLLNVNKDQELRWRGNILGMDFLFAGEHYFVLTKNTDATTTLTHGEHFSGIMLPLIWGSIKDDTRAGFTAFNEALKHEVEK